MEFNIEITNDNILSPPGDWINPRPTDPNFEELPIVFGRGGLYSQTVKAISKPVILVCSTGDPTTNDPPQLSPLIKKVYCTNFNTNLDCGQAIPLGMLEEHAIDLLSIKKQRFKKTKLVYCSFDVGTHRSRNFNTAYKNDYRATRDQKQLRKNRLYFFEQVAQHKFAFAPRGNGIDTYRMWEVLSLGIIPIVQKSAFTSHFRGLIPMLEVSDFSIINDNFLLDQYEQISQQKYNYQAITRDYWIQKFYQDAMLLKNKEKI